MLKFGTLMTVLCVLPLAACTSTTTVNSGAGFERLSPSSASRSFIIKNDRPFAEQVAAHNKTCDAQQACRK